MTFNALPPESVNLLARICARASSESARTGRRPPAKPMSQAPSPEPTASPSALNVLGQPLEICSCAPVTGWYRDGSCRTDAQDQGMHTVCCIVSEAFLTYSRAQGNDLSSPVLAFGFPGLKPGDHWCLCARRWLQAYEDGMAPPVRLEACEQSTLTVIPLAALQGHAAPGNGDPDAA